MTGQRQFDKADYVSPIARRGMQMAEHPEWSLKYEFSPGYCACRIIDSDGQEQGFGEVDGPDGSADQRSTLRTKAKGRALKDAGYPSSRRDLSFIKGYRKMLAGHFEEPPRALPLIEQTTEARVGEVTGKGKEDESQGVKDDDRSGTGDGDGAQSASSPEAA